jgi:hypothetical protein
MQRALIAWNIPNMITIPLMAFIGFLIAGVIWQLVMKAQAGTGNTSAAGSY